MSKKIFLFIGLMILPIFLFVLEIVVYHSKGEFFLCANYDGPYGLLLASLNLTQFKSPGFFQHPGAIPILISAFVIKINHLLQGNNPNIVIDIFDRPEFYLYQINLTFTLFTCTALLILGVVAFRKIGSFFAAFFLQFTPFVAFLIIYQIAQNILETTTIIVILLLIASAISYIHDSDFSVKKNIYYCIIFGIICGIGLANKISILPIMIIPFLLIKKFRYKALFITVSLCVFFSIFLIISSQKNLFFAVLYDSIFSSGKSYTQGPSNFSDQAQIMKQVNSLMRDFLLFCIAYIATIVILLIQFIPKFKSRIRSNRYFIFLIGIFIVMTAFIMLEIKTHLPYYVMPGLLFTVTVFFIINSIISELIPKLFKLSKYLFLYILFFALIIPQAKAFKSSVDMYVFRKKQSYELLNFINENYKNAIIISTSLVTGHPTPFYLGLPYSGDESKYFSIIKERYPRSLYFQKWSKIFMNVNVDLVKTLDKSDTIIYIAADEANFNDFKVKFIELTQKPNTEFTQIYKNANGERIYLVRLD